MASSKPIAKKNNWLDKTGLILLSVVFIGLSILFYAPILQWVQWWKVEREGQLASHEGHYLQAITLYTEGSKRFTNDNTFTLRLARLYQETGQNTEALRLYKEGLQQATKKPELNTRLNYARLLANQKNWNAAIEQMRLSLHEWGKQRSTFFELGRLYQKAAAEAKQKGYPQTEAFMLRNAVYYLNWVLKLDKTYTPARYALGQVQQAKRDWPKAMEAFCAITQQQPNHYEAWYQLGYSLSELGFYSQGVKLMQAAMQMVHPDVAPSEADKQEGALNDEQRHLAYSRLSLHFVRLRQEHAGSSAESPVVLPENFGSAQLPKACLNPPLSPDEEGEKKNEAKE